MFTGLVERMGRLRSGEPCPSGRRLVVEADGWPDRASAGESICVDGCCLTLVKAEAGGLHFDVVPQTLQRTTLGAMRPGDAVNLERSIRADALLGGHLVQGHVDGVAVVISVDRSGGGWRTRMEMPAGIEGLLVDRGSVAVDGVSLTVAACGPGWFEVALVPETLSRTTLAIRLQGSRVNVEADVMAKMVAAQVRRHLEAISGSASPAR